jgi:hypothetical protein
MKSKRDTLNRQRGILIVVGYYSGGPILLRIGLQGVNESVVINISMMTTKLHPIQLPSLNIVIQYDHSPPFIVALTHTAAHCSGIIIFLDSFHTTLVSFVL